MVVRQHLCKNLVQLGPNAFLHQMRGIPQGSILSSLLCCCVYAHLEHHRLRPVPSLHLDPPLSPAAAKAMSSSPPFRPAQRGSTDRGVRWAGNGASAPAVGSPRVQGGSGAAGKGAGAGGTQVSMEDAEAGGYKRQAGGVRAALSSPSAGNPRRKPKMARLESVRTCDRGSSTPASAPTAPAAPPQPQQASVSRPQLAVESCETAAGTLRGKGDGGGGVDRKVGEHIQDSEASLLLRVVDDFLYISADLKLARAFVRCVSCGHEDYGVEINVDKSSVNFDVQLAVPTSANNEHHAKTEEERLRSRGCRDAASAGAAGAQRHGRASQDQEHTRTVTMERAAQRELAWCGLLLDTRTLEVRRDYSRYAGGNLRDAITSAFDSKPGQRLRDRTIGAVKSKLLPILLDSTVNSPRRVRYNVYQAAAFGALVMGAHARALANMFRHSSSFFYEAVLAVMGSIFPHIKALEGSSKLAQAGVSMRVSRHVIEWLSAHAFLTVLQVTSRVKLGKKTREDGG